MNAQWQTGQFAPDSANQIGPNDWWLAAVLQFSADDYQHLTTSLTPSTDIVSLPDALTLGFMLSEPLINRIQHETANIYSPATFAKSPLLHGILQIDPEHKTLFIFMFTQ